MDEDGDEPLHLNVPLDEQQAREEEEAFANQDQAFMNAANHADPLLEAMMNEFQFPDDGGFDQDMMVDHESEEEEEIEDEDDEQRPHLEEFPEDDDALLDSTAEQVEKGKDIQGIPWSTTPWTRDAYRRKRNTDYNSYYNCENEVKAAAATIKSQCLASHTLSARCDARYTFYRNWRRVRSTIVHFQLRNLVWPVTSHQILYVASNRIMQWQNQTRGTEPRPLLDMSRSPASNTTITTIRTATGANVNNESIDRVVVCTMCAKYGIVAAGGFGGELVVTQLNMNEMTCAKRDDDYDFENYDKYNDDMAAAQSQGTKALGTRVSSSENGITNAIDIYNSVSGTPSIVCSNNDQAVRLFDAATLSPKGEFKLPWAVNYTAAHPAQGRVLCVVGDHPEAVLLDSTSGSKIATLRGHYDYSFAAAWHPDGNIVATGNQDLTTRIYDLRMVSRSLCVLHAQIGAVRSLRFAPDGKTLAVAEPADYVTLYNVVNDYATCQSLDVFGEISGIGYSPDSKRFYAAVSDVHYASLLQLNVASGNAEDGGRSLDEQWLLEKGMYCRKK